MTTMAQSEMFFLISSVGFIVLGILALVLFLYLIRITKAFSRIIENAEKDIEKMGDISADMLDDIRDSAFFHFLFKKKKKGSK